MAKKMKNLNANLIWDILMCEVVFGPTGIQLNTTEYPGQQPDLAGALSSISKKTRPATKAALERAAMEIGRVPAEQKSLSKEALRRIGETREWGDLSAIFFQPQENKIEIRRDRATQLLFYSRNAEWLFDPPGLFLDSPLDPAIGTLAEPEIIDYGQTVWTTFLPNPLAPAMQFKYNLRLITSVLNFGASAGHAIIIVDPIIETSKF